MTYYDPSVHRIDKVSDIMEWRKKQMLVAASGPCRNGKIKKLSLDATWENTRWSVSVVDSNGVNNRVLDTSDVAIAVDHYNNL